MLLHAFDVVLAPDAKIDECILFSGVKEALASAFPVLEEPCYVFEISNYQKSETEAWAANRVTVEPLTDGRARVCLPVVE